MSSLAGTAAFAADPIKLNCPAGTTQQMSPSKDGFGCVGKGAKHTAVTQGPVVFIHPNGVKALEGRQEGNFRVGTWTAYDENGVKTEVFEMKRSVRDGKATQFYPNGAVKKVEQYKDGQLVAVLQQFDANGQAVTTTAAK
ncbi:MAG: toxin-antitoxin system YwqK family antitoxin [Myxococcaceae bacterium]